MDYILNHLDAVVTFVLGWLGKNILEGIKDSWQERRGGRVGALRRSLYTELSRNIGQLQNIVDLVQQNPHQVATLHQLVEQSINEERYQAAKSDHANFYKLGREADLIDVYYKTFRRLSNAMDNLPVEASQQTIAHFYIMLRDGALNRKIMKKVGGEWIRAQILAVEPGPWWRFWQPSR